MADGTLHSQKMTVIANTGAYGTHGLTVQTVTGLRGLSSYNCPNRHVRLPRRLYQSARTWRLSRLRRPAGAFRLEVHMDEIAHELGIDTIDFRKKNWVQAGDPMPIAPLLGEGEKDTVIEVPIIQSCGLNECFEQG